MHVKSVIGRLITNVTDYYTHTDVGGPVDFLVNGDLQETQQW